MQPAFKQAETRIQKADLLIVGGTSLKVHPTADLVAEFLNPAYSVIFGKNKPKRLVIINNQSTDFDSDADLVFNMPLSKVFKALDTSREQLMLRDARVLSLKRFKYSKLNSNEGSFVYLSQQDKELLNQMTYVSLRMSDDEWKDKLNTHF